MEEFFFFFKNPIITTIIDYVFVLGPIDNISRWPTQIPSYMYFKSIVSKLTMVFWMCQKCGKMNKYYLKMTTCAEEWLQTRWIWY
jgi:hypothetical protein